MLKILIIALCAIVCLIGASFYSHDAKTQSQRSIWQFCFILSIILIVVQGYETWNSTNMFDYSEVATWNIKGDQSINRSYVLPGKISGWTEGFLDNSDGKIKVRYDDTAILHYKKIMSEYPRYPFSYYFLAEAYKIREDPIWKKYAKKAIKILEITTACPLHAPNQDDVLKSLKAELAPSNH
jgi:hypothetical protein